MTEPEELARAEAIAHKLLAGDPYCQWLGVVVEEATPTVVTLSLTVRAEMSNGLGISHGGIAFSLADTAFAFAVNCGGRICVTVNGAISYAKAVRTGDRLVARAEVTATTRNLAFCEATVRDGEGTPVAIFHGTAFRTKGEHTIQDI